MTTDVTNTKASAAPATARRPLPTFTEQLIEPFSRLRGEIDRLFDDFPLRLPSLRLAGDFLPSIPALEMTETKKAYKITAELPGMESADVEVSVEDDILRIAGEKQTERDEDEQGCRLSERTYGSFERLVRLPSGAQADKVRAKCRNGVLTVTIPKDGKAQERVHKIAVE